MMFEVGAHMTLVRRGRSIIQDKYTLIMWWTTKLSMTIVSLWCLQGCFWPFTERLLMSLISREFQPNYWASSVNPLNLSMLSCMTSSECWAQLCPQILLLFTNQTQSINYQSVCFDNYWIIMVSALSGPWWCCAKSFWPLLWAQHTSSTFLTIALFAYPGIDLSNYPGRTLTNIHQFFLF